MGIMDIVGGLAKILQTPQSVATGGTIGLLRALGQDSGFDKDEYNSNKAWVADLQNQGMDTSELEKKLFGGLQGVGNPLEGITKGFTEGFTPSDVMRDVEFSTRGKNENDVLSQLGNTTADLGLDPLMLAGIAAKPLAEAGKLGKVGKGLDTAFSAGKLGEDATRGDKIATALLRGARRTYQGTVATGDPLTGLGAGALLGLGENKLAQILPGALARATRGVAEEVDNIPSAVQLAGKPTVPQGFDVSSMVGAQKPGMTFDVADMIGTQKPMAGPLIPDEIIQRGAMGPGPQPMGAIGPATAIEGQVGSRPMGPVPEFADASFERVPMSQSPFDLPQQTIQEVLGNQKPQDIIEKLVGQPVAPRRPQVLMDPMLNPNNKQNIIDMLDELLRNG